MIDTGHIGLVVEKDYVLRVEVIAAQEKTAIIKVIDSIPRAWTGLTIKRSIDSIRPDACLKETMMKNLSGEIEIFKTKEPKVEYKRKSVKVEIPSKIMKDTNKLTEKEKLDNKKMILKRLMELQKKPSQERTQDK